jgi:3',5'-cyclic AMP phosphodiesterase CpdA
MKRIRAKRQKPGLLKQHLTAVEVATTVGCAEVDGAALSSQTLEFRTGPVTPGNYRFAVGTAGSTTLVLQTPAVEADAVILAGDISTDRNGLKWALKTFPDRPVIYVLGNHELQLSFRECKQCGRQGRIV